MSRRDWYDVNDSGFVFDGEGAEAVSGADRLRALLLPDEAETCGASCACHGNVVCRLAPGHAHGDTVTRADGSTDTDTHPHVGMNADQEIVQWEHTDAHGPQLTEAQVSESESAARRAHTYALLDGLDVTVLREMTMTNVSRNADGSA